MNKKQLNEVLNIDESVEIIKPAPQDDEEEIDTEYEYTKSNLHHIIDRGTDALEEMIMIADFLSAPSFLKMLLNL